MLFKLSLSQIQPWSSSTKALTPSSPISNSPASASQTSAFPTLSSVALGSTSASSTLGKKLLSLGLLGLSLAVGANAHADPIKVLGDTQVVQEEFCLVPKGGKEKSCMNLNLKLLNTDNEKFNQFQLGMLDRKQWKAGRWNGKNLSVEQAKKDAIEHISSKIQPWLDTLQRTIGWQPLIKVKASADVTAYDELVKQEGDYVYLRIIAKYKIKDAPVFFLKGIEDAYKAVIKVNTRNWTYTYVERFNSGLLENDGKEEKRKNTPVGADFI